MAVTSIELKFADGDYLFALPLPQLRELQRLCGAGIFTIYGRVMKGRYLLGDQPVAVPEEGEAFVDDLNETVRLALIGGAKGLVNDEEVTVSPLRARQLVDTYCYPAVPLRETWSITAAVLATCMVGFDPPAAKKKAPGRRKLKTATT